MKRFVNFMVKVDDSTMTKLAIDPRQIMAVIKSVKAGDCEAAFEVEEADVKRKERFDKTALKAGASIMLYSGGVMTVMESFEETQQILEDADNDFIS